MYYGFFITSSNLDEIAAIIELWKDHIDKPSTAAVLLMLNSKTQNEQNLSIYEAQMHRLSGLWTIAVLVVHNMIDISEIQDNRFSKAVLRKSDDSEESDGESKHENKDSALRQIGIGLLNCLNHER